jgi:hypothetical protein
VILFGHTRVNSTSIEWISQEDSDIGNHREEMVLLPLLVFVSHPFLSQLNVDNDDFIIIGSGILGSVWGPGVSQRTPQGANQQCAFEGGMCQCVYYF